MARVWHLLQGSEPALGLHGPNPDCAVGHNGQQALTSLDQAVSESVATELDHVILHDVMIRSLTT